MTALHFDITGDCTGALAALSNTESAIDRVGGMTANPSVGVMGAATAISQLNGVADAATAASQAVNISTDVRGLSGAQASVAALRGEVRGMSQDLSSVGGLDVGVTGGGAVQQMSGFVRGLGSAFESAATGTDSFADSGGRASDIGSQMQRDFSGATMATQDHTAAMQDHRSVVQGLTDDHRELASVGTGAQNAAGGVSDPGRESFQRVARQFNANQRATDGSFFIRTATNPNATPPGGPPGGDDGGGGGGGGGGDDDGRRGLHHALQPLLMGTVIGGAESLLTGAAGLMAVNEAIKQTPALAYAANGAMQQFDKGIRQAATSAIAEGVPALHALGTELRGLGTEVGTIGAEHMGTALNAASDLAGNATQALKHLDPAIDSSIKGLVGLADAVMGGISNPAVVQSIKSVGDALADPRNEAGITSLVSGLGSVSAVAATVAANVAGTVGNLTGTAGPEAQGPIMGAGIGGYIGKTLLGGPTGFLLGAGILGEATREQQAGEDPTAGVVGGVGGALAAMALKFKGLPLLATAAAGDFMAQDIQATGGGAFTHAATPSAPTPWSHPFTPTGSGSWRDSTWLGKAYGSVADALGGQPKSPTAAPDTPAASSPFPTAGMSAGDVANAGRYGWQQETDSKGSTTMRPGTAADRASNTHLEAVRRSQQGDGGAAAVARQMGGSWTGIPQGIVPQGPGESVGSAAALQRLNQAMTTTASGSTQLQTHNTALAQSLDQVSQHTTTSSSGVTQLQQRSTSLAPSFQQVTQHANTAALAATMLGQNFSSASSQVQQLPKAVAPTLQSLQTIPQQVSTSMSQASTTMVRGGNEIGKQLPSSMGTGISANTSQACDAAAQLSVDATKCAASALGTKSPSKAFEVLGESTGSGFAIGATNSIATASGAVGSALSGVTDAARGVASNQGLSVGYSYIESLVTGAQQAVGLSQFQQLGFPEIKNAAAKADLGARGLLGPAGSGAQSYKLESQEVSFGGGVAAQPPPIMIQPHDVILNGAVIATIAQQEVAQGLNRLTDSLSRQRNG